MAGSGCRAGRHRPGRQQAAVAATTASAYLPWLIIGLPAGAWVDRSPWPQGKRSPATSCLLLFTLVCLLRLGPENSPSLKSLRSPWRPGSVSVLFTTAYRVLLPSLVAPDDLIEGNAKLQGSAAAAAIGGRAASGIAAEAVGAATALMFNAASFAVSAACLLAIRPAA